SSDHWIPAGSRLPGWQLSVSLTKDQAFNEMARRQTASLVWVGFLAIVAISITALIAGQAFRRHWQRARLKTDLVPPSPTNLRRRFRPCVHWSTRCSTTNGP